MEKKNTMLLTVIAVATLLVAVVGATFAYFSLTVDNNTSSTVIKAQSQDLPTITMTGGKENFGIAVAAADMALNDPGARWAMNTGDGGSIANASSGKDAGDGNLYYWSKTEVKYDLFNIKASKTGDENNALTYECPVSITLTAKDKVDALQQGDLILYLYSKNGDVMVSEPVNGSDESDSQNKTDGLIDDWKSNTKEYLMETTGSHEGTGACSGENGCYDVSDLFKLASETKTLHTVVIVQADNTNSDGTSVQASMKLINKSDANQSSLAGQSIQITLTSKLAQEGCKVITKEAE